MRNYKKKITKKNLDEKLTKELEEMEERNKKFIEQCENHPKKFIPPENKCKVLSINEQEKINFANLSNQKVKYMENELEQNKDEIKKLNIKITNYLNQIDKLKDEVYKEKETTSKKYQKLD